MPPIERQPSTFEGFLSPRSVAVRRPARATAAKSQRGFGLSYKFACAVCGKTFKRDSYNATLNPHKNKQGWPCPGRVGFLKATST